MNIINRHRFQSLVPAPIKAISERYDLKTLKEITDQLISNIAFRSFIPKSIYVITYDDAEEKIAHLPKKGSELQAYERAIPQIIFAVKITVEKKLGQQVQELDLIEKLETLLSSNEP